MPVFIYEDDAFERMAAVEQDDRWVEKQRDGSFGHDCLFSSFKEEWERTWKARQEEHPKESLNRYGLDVNGTGAIYGSLGYNRYTVRADGEIMFIRMQARSDEDVRRALEQGFRMFPPRREP